MVAQEEAPQSTQQQENTGTFGKLKQTLSSSLLTAQDRGEKANNNLSLFELLFESSRVDFLMNFSVLKKLRCVFCMCFHVSARLQLLIRVFNNAKIRNFQIIMSSSC